MSDDKYAQIKVCINSLGVKYAQILQPEKLDIVDLREKAEAIEELSQILLSDIENLESQLEEGTD